MCADSFHLDSSAAIVCMHAIFQGSVQGVGFRYRTSRLVRKYPICGFVRNLPDGTVELVVQSREKTVLDDFFDEMMLAFATNVTDVSIQEIMPDTSLVNFSIER